MLKKLTGIGLVLGLFAGCTTDGSSDRDRGIFRSAAGVVTGDSSRPGEIRECGTADAQEAEVMYPAGWASRVSQAETEDELLGGGTRVNTQQRVRVSNLPDTMYPQAALSPPLEARCEIKFDLSTQGLPSNILAACSSPLFIDEANRIVSQATFEPLRVNDRLAKGVNVVYVHNFCLSDQIFGTS
ncbi:MAG: energy transducer TonB [Pseudomonadota bacterium]